MEEAKTVQWKKAKKIKGRKKKTKMKRLATWVLWSKKRPSLRYTSIFLVYLKRLQGLEFGLRDAGAELGFRVED